MTSTITTPGTSSRTSNVAAKTLAGKVAIVTGASKGIGAEIALQLAQAGASVVVNYASSRQGADRVVDQVKNSGGGGKAVAIQADVARKADIERLFTETIKAFGRVDILINNAGVYEFSPIENITEEHFHRQFNINVLGLILASQEFVKHFDPNQGGSIINISSVVSTYLPPTAAVYAATKAAVDAVTRVLAKELGPRGIRVNSINPGMVETEGMRSQGFHESDFRRQVESTTPLGRIGQPNDIAPAVVFLASNQTAGWITGETLVIAGGSR